MDHFLSHAPGLFLAVAAFLVFGLLSLVGLFEVWTGARRRQNAAAALMLVAGMLTAFSGVASVLAIAANIARLARG